MIVKNLFNDQVTLAVSVIADGNMRTFSDEEFNTVLNNQSKLSTALNTDPEHTARVLTTYVDRGSFTEYYEISEDTITKHQITKPEAALMLADGLVAKSNNFALLLPLADCLGIIFYSIFILSYIT